MEVCATKYMLKNEIVKSVECTELLSKQEEADTKCFFMQKHLADKGYDSVVIKSSDTDVEVLACYFQNCISSNIIIMTGCKPMTTSLPSLPGNTACYITDTCNTVQCCTNVDKIGQSYEAEVSIDQCLLKLSVRIEKLQLNKDLLNFQWGVPVEMWLFGLVRVRLTLYNLETEGNIMIDMTLSVCLDADVSVPCYHTVHIFKDHKLPKSACEWKSGFPVPGFDLESWLSSNSLPVNMDLLPQWSVEYLLQEWGIRKFVTDQTCSEIFTDFDIDNTAGCSLVLPVLPSWMICSVTSTCDGVICCITLPKINKTIPVALQIEDCRNAMHLQIGKLQTKMKLTDLDYGNIKPFSLSGIVNMMYTVQKLKDDHQYIVDLSLSVCYTDKIPCDYEVSLLTSNIISFGSCEISAGFLNPDFSLTNWLSDSGLTVNSVITDVTSDRLITELGLSDFVGYSDSCSLTVSPYKDAINGWNNECSSVTTLPALSGDIACHMSSCSQFSCCVYNNILRRSLKSSIHLDTCSYMLKVSIEDLHYEFQMLNYQWGEIQNVRLHGVFSFSFTIYNIPSESKLSVDAEIKLCFEANNNTCLKEYSILSNVQLKYEVCNQTQPVGGLAFDFWKQSYCTSYTGDFLNGCSSVPSPISSLSGCHLSSDCQGIECCVGTNFISGSRNVETMLKISQCDVMDGNIERKTWTKSGLDSLTGSSVSEKVNDVFDLMVDVIESSSSLYKVTVSLKTCYIKDIGLVRGGGGVGME
ncbi:unnamed protein product [Mytilus coruscus]|uniref:Uncharacterized protein n=1 Tax=Mytilus coruscus TaxID=42192 RepID=A0A6J8D1K8_MYTCO|nr:unnamed protein product [Mytilus coruscus]